MKAKLKEQYKKELKRLIEVMDKRDKFYLQIEEHKLKYGEIPEKYIPAWTAYISDGKKSWRRMPGVIKRLKQTAKKTAENILNMNKLEKAKEKKNDTIK